MSRVYASRIVRGCSHFAFLVSDGGQIAFGLIVHNTEMEDVKAIPRIIEALRFKDGVVITFEDNKCALYPTALLYAMFSNANELVQETNDGD